MNNVITKIDKKINDLLNSTLEEFIQILNIKAVNPSMGGNGEYERALVIQKILEKYNFDEIKRYDAKDERVTEGIRPNIVARIRGNDVSHTLWLLAHMDTVPEGDRSLWDADPFKPIIKDGKIICRGAEDNGQAIASILLATKTLLELNIKPSVNLGLAFVSDEEAGSVYGVQHLIEHNVFNKGSIVIVPDAGSPDGSMIEVAEKGILWFKITTRGRQAHGSMPHKGLNAHRIGMKYALELDEIFHNKYTTKNQLFDPPESTFEPTRKEKNVDNVNTIPGTDVIYFDCRILPEYNIDDVLLTMNKLKVEYEQKHNVKIDIEIVQRNDPAPPTPGDSDVVKRLSSAIEMLRGFKPKLMGIGGGTVAAFFRKQGIPAAVWSTLDEVAHQPNEYSKIGNIVADAKVFALASII
ncbi:MAG: M20 family metallo-hydrolase [Thermoprotei archaeon]